MNNRWLYILIFTLGILTSLTACRDDFDYSEVGIGEGESKIGMCIEYEPNISAMDTPSRAAGNAISEINDLAVVIYKPNGDLYKIYNSIGGDLKLIHSINVSVPEDYGTTTEVAEDTTARVTFELPETLPFGRYQIYCVANLGSAVTETMAADAETLKSQTMTWNWDDVSKNSQMFGYMTPDDNRTSSGFEAPLLIINKQSVQLHSWIKRLASKVTVAFDGSGLHQNIFVYVHNVSIRQLPLTCPLGKPNKPTEASQISTDGYQADHGYTPVSELHRSQYFIYNDSNIVEVDKYPETDDYTHWLTVANGSGIRGSKNHTKNDPALYFYENMQGDYADDADKEKYNKTPDPSQAGINVVPGMADYKDNVPLGTFVEVEAYYVSNNDVNISSGPIKYRFMLGQNTTYNYDAIRNHHYKLTLGFRGFANQPDWHIEYYEDTPDIFAPMVYMPYLYNQSVNYPLRFNGNLQELEITIIENNWAPYDMETGDVPPETVGKDSFDDRVLQFNWNKVVYENSKGRESTTLPTFTSKDEVKSEDGNNFLYGLHKSTYKHLVPAADGKGMEEGTEPYYVTPVWVGFLRLQQPKEYEDESVHLPMGIFAEDGTWIYSRPRTINGLKKYYEGTGGETNGGVSYINNGNNLGYLHFTAAELTEGRHGNGRNAYTVEHTGTGEDATTTVNLQFWTQPKSLGYISGFSGSNPYESYFRKAVIRVKARFTVRTGQHDETKYLLEDIPIFQGRRLVNPKGVWRTADDTTPFNFVLLDRENEADISFEPLRSYGEWSAYVSAGSGITLTPSGGSRASSTHPGGIEGDTDSEIRFTINFAGGYNCAIIDVLYHGNNCVHRVFCRQGYNEPLSIVDGEAKWSSYSVYSCDPDFEFGSQDGYVDCDLTVDPLALGSLFKKGNYREGLSISNNQVLPIMTPTKGAALTFTNGVAARPWHEIVGIARANDIKAGVANGVSYTFPQPSKTTTTNITYTYNGSSITKSFNSKTWHWAGFNGKTFDGVTKHYKVPTYSDFKALKDYADIGVGVLYGNGAKEPQIMTRDAFGFFDATNTVRESEDGMRGFFVYNVDNANNIFFPVGTSGIGRRPMQNLRDPWENYQGTLRYGSLPFNLTQVANKSNSLRPIPFNIMNAPGAIYWLYSEDDNNCGWDFNYFDMNFNTYDYGMSVGPYGDAVPIKLVLDDE